MKTDKTPSYLIIGNGRVAKHLHSYFDLMKVPFLSWNRRENSESQLLSMLEAMKEAASPIVLLPIKDSAIQEFFDKHISRFNYTAYHFSGASVIKNVLSAHPLMTFGHELYDSDFYKKIFFAVSSKSNFKKHFPFLPNPAFELHNDNKPLYHALCVMSGNFPNILWNSCLNVFKSLNIPQEAAFLYLQKTLENFCKDPKNSLTGPLVRNDKDTIDKNLTALSPNMRDVYKAFVKFYFNQFKNV